MAYQRYISPAELAVRWGVSVSAIRQGMCGTRRLTRVRLGRNVRYILEEIESFERTIEKLGRKLSVQSLEESPA